jgi:YD repeat-containing protein
MSTQQKWTGKLGQPFGLIARRMRREVVHPLMLIALLTVGTLAHAVPSIAGGWIDIDSGTQFFNSPEDLCGGRAEYESSVEVLCPENRNWRIYGVLAYACPPGTLPGGWPEVVLQLRHLGPSSGWAVDNEGFVRVGVGRSGDCYSWGGSLQVSLHGGSQTKALPAGPALAQVATVTRGGQPASAQAVTVRIGNFAAITGLTDNAGQFAFTYIPPHLHQTEQVTATCAGCTNTASKYILVSPSEVCEGTKGNPIQPASGEKLEAELDWPGFAAHLLPFSRHYRSYGNSDTGLGINWSHNWSAVVAKSDFEAAISLGDGTKVQLLRETRTGTWRSLHADTLQDTGAGPLFTRALDESGWQFDASGKLTSIVQRNGWRAVLAYDEGGKLSSVANHFGQTLRFAYSGERLASVATPDGATLHFGYDVKGRLAWVRFGDGSQRWYHYEDARHPGALTGLTDESGQRYANFAYDAQGRAIFTSHAGAAQSFTITYAQGTTTGRLAAGMVMDPSIYVAAADVIDPLGNPQRYTWTGGDGRVRLAGSSGAFEGSRVANRNFVGLSTLPQQETDFLGVSTAYTWDLSRQLKVATTKAAGPPRVSDQIC